MSRNELARPWRRRAQRVSSLILAGSGVAVTLLCSGACELFERVPAYQVDLIGTTWAIESAGDRDLSGVDLTLSFPEVDRYALSSACRTLRGGFSYDTDGAYIGFDQPAVAPDGCPESIRQAESLVVDALLDVEEWRVRSEDSIELTGGEPLVLVRV